MQNIVEDILVSYARIGSGKRTLLCLHGWADSARTFDALAKDLASKYTVYAVDLPGFGATEMPKSTWGLAEYADFASKFIKKLGIKPHAVIGHSNGGAIAMYGVSQELFKSDKLVLISSSGIRNVDKLNKKLLKTAAKPAKLLLKPLPQKTQNKIKKKLYGKIGSDLYAAEHMQDIFKNVVSYDIQQEASIIQTPTLLIYGEQDSATPPKYGELLHQCIEGSTLALLPGGHFIHQEKPNEISKLITGFLA